MVAIKLSVKGLFLARIKSQQKLGKVICVMWRISSKHCRKIKLKQEIQFKLGSSPVKNFIFFS